MDAETTEMLRATLRQVLPEVRGAEVIPRLFELGWDEVLVDDAPAAIGTLFEEQGRALVPSPALDVVLIAALRPLLGDDAAGTSVCYPSVAAGWAPTSVAKPAGAVDVVVSGVGLAGFGRAARVCLPVSLGGEVGLGVVDGGDWLVLQPLGGIDPTAGWVQVEGRTTVPAGQIVGGAEAADAWRTAVDWARRAQGHELVGITERMLEIAVEHVKDRHQFGRPIGSFQAVKHRLAEALVALTAARLALAEAWRDDSEPLARVARVLAGRAQAETAAHCLQVCGGIGFTWEFPLRGYVRRGALVEALLGSWRSLRADVGRELVRTQVVPRLPAL